MLGYEWLARSLKASGQTHFFFVDAVLRHTLLELERVGVQPVLAHTEKAAVYMARTRSPRVLIGLLAGNPFPDSSRGFFDAMENALSAGLAFGISIDAPFSTMTKADVIRLGQTLGVPFELTLSCMQPVRGEHCGRCSKCRERRDAFAEAGVEDPARR